MALDPARYPMDGTTAHGGARVSAYRSALSCINCGDGVNGGTSNKRCGTRVVSATATLDTLCSSCGCGYNPVGGVSTFTNAGSCHDSFACLQRDPDDAEPRSLTATVTPVPAIGAAFANPWTAALTCTFTKDIDSASVNLSTCRLYNVTDSVWFALTAASRTSVKVVTMTHPALTAGKSWQFVVEVFDVNGYIASCNTAFTTTAS